MPEFRWNPLLDTWTMVATNRQHRPHLPKDYCPFCPSQNKALPKYDVMAYENDFPVMSLEKIKVKSQKSKAKSGIFKKADAIGKCEVILYSPDHNKKLYQLSIQHVCKIVLLWHERFVALSKDERIKYIFPFENRGEEVGVTMPHPHGQLYAYSFVPAKVREELHNSKQYYKQNGKSIFADLNAAEKKYKKRVVYENDSFIAYIPYFTDYPFGVYVVSKKLIAGLHKFRLSDTLNLADMLRKLTAAFDKIYGRPFPYMMCLYQAPVNDNEYAGAEKYYPFHIKFFPPLRAKDKIKWYAGSEMGAGAAANPLDVDECAAILRSKISKKK